LENAENAENTDSSGFSWPPKRLVIAGFGLLGGSIAQCCQQKFLDIQVLAVGRNENRLKKVVEAGLANDFSTDPQKSVKSGDLVVLCQPVDVITQILPEFCAHLPENVVVTDVGSTKARIVQEADSSKKGRHQFVGSHPMAGSEKTGWENSRADLFQDATTILTPTEHSSPELVSYVTKFWEMTGSRVVWMDAKRHDELVGLVSHLPHLTASALVDVLVSSGDDAGLLSIVSGNGLRDTTRVAEGSADLWQQIALDNADVISLQLEEMAEKLQSIAMMLRDRRREDLTDLLERTSEFRKKLNGKPNHS